MRRLLVVLALLLVGCGSDDAPAAQVEETETEADHHAALLTENEETDAEVLRLEGELAEANDRISTLETTVEELATAIDVRLSELEDGADLVKRMHRCLKEVIYQWGDGRAPACYIF